MAVNLTDLNLVAKMRKAGIVNPIYTLQAARAAKLDLSIACAILSQESGGGHNVWGHDPTIFIGGGSYGSVVTPGAYKAYLKERGPTGRGGMQGVGPCQLTYYSYQDKADHLGGCWLPRWNMQVGFQLVHDLIQKDGLHAGIAGYNGSGPAAESYADTVISRIGTWDKILGKK